MKDHYKKMLSFGNLYGYWQNHRLLLKQTLISNNKWVPGKI